MRDVTTNPRMIARHEGILSLLRRRGFVSIGGLAESFRVSEQTVRRDLKALEKQGQVTRYHGGAGLPSGPADRSCENRKVSFAAEKKRIARKVATDIPEGATVFIDIGTTMEAIAEALLDHRGLTVITNHPFVAVMLSRHPNSRILPAGGNLRHNDHATTGEASRVFPECSVRTSRCPRMSRLSSGSAASPFNRPDHDSDAARDAARRFGEMDTLERLGS